MHSREEPLTKREQTELQGYVSWKTFAFGAVLFVAAVAAFGALCWRVQQWLAPSGPHWLLPTLVAGVFLYIRSGRWTGGRAFRNLIRLDLQANTALVHHIRVQDAIVFEELEDEGPIVFVLTEDGETLVFLGQELSHQRGFPWRELEIREAAHSRMFLRLKKKAEPFWPSAVRPPLSPERFRKLGLSSVGRWKQLQVPFEQLRQIASVDRRLK
jgi:nitrate reductase NapE component